MNRKEGPPIGRKTKPDTKQQNKTEKVAKPELALDGWGYAETELAKLFVTLSKGDKKLQRSLELAYQQGGGKALSLKISELVANNFGDKYWHLIVPKWEIRDSLEEIDPKKEHNKIVRSSNSSEDWLNSESGGGKSFNFAYNPTDRVMFNIAVDPEFKVEKSDHYILQSAKRGFGLVVDIGYSPLYDEPLVRIASGNERYDSTNDYSGITSATQDSEAAVAVWRARTGEVVLPTRDFIRFATKNAFYKNPEMFKHLPKLLADSIKNTGIEFGVQLEMIVHPSEPITGYLVQTRPSPKDIFEPLIFEQKSPDKKPDSNKLFCRTAVVNRAFDFSGEADFMDTRKVTVVNDLGNRAHKDTYSQSFRKAVPLSLDRVSSPWLADGAGKISIFTASVDRYLEWDKAPKTHLGAYKIGYEAQITVSAICPNSHHEDMQYGKDTLDIYAKLNEKCGMISLPQTEISRLQRVQAEKGEPLKLRVISDGLIAEVYIL